MRQLLQITAISLQHPTFITECDSVCVNVIFISNFTIYFIRKHLRITEQYRPIERAILSKPKIHWLLLSLLMLFRC